MNTLDPLLALPDLAEGARYADREVSQLAFNARVLAMALDEREPLLERVKFCAIYSGNTDEWVQKRLDLIRQEVAQDGETPGWGSPGEQLAAIRDVLAETGIRQARIFSEVLVPALAAEGIVVRSYGELHADGQAACDVAFNDRMFPLLTPLAIDPGRPFPHISTMSTNLAVKVRLGPGRTSLARVKIPRQLKRFVVLNEDNETILIPTEQVIAANLDLLFPDVEVIQHGVFRVTRHAHQMFAEDEAEDLLETIESGLLERRFGTVVRLEAAEDCPEELYGPFVEELGAPPESVAQVPGLLDLAGLWQIAGLDRPDLRHPAWQPTVPATFGRGDDLWARIRQSDVLVHHPYESFEQTTLQFIERAAIDPQVVGIKLTIYRTTETDSPVIGALIRAAEAGKQVVALVELKARFDEEANIRRARNLESSGVHVVYGLIGLKTHTKTCLVIREEHGGLRRYAHVGTGNYNPSTARIYEDVGVFTTRPEVGADLSELFNMLTGYSRRQDYRSLLVAPRAMRDALLDRIHAERDAGADGHILWKINNLVDQQIIEALYETSQAGARVDLIVRSMCALVPGVPGMSENITVRSIVGRFLEHSRIFRFGTPDRGLEYLIGSADMMARNLDRRVEAIIPVTDVGNQAELQQILDTLLADERLAWVLQSSGRWTRVDGDPDTSSHVVLHRLAKERAW